MIDDGAMEERIVVGLVGCGYWGPNLIRNCSQRGELVALIPMREVWSPWTDRRGVCLPFTDFCGPLMFGEGGAALAMDKLTEVARERKWKYFKVRGRRTLEASATPALAFYGHTLDLRRGTEDPFTRFKSSARRALRKAERSGLSVQVTQTREAILEFYRLQIRTRRRHGLPPQPLSFFLNIHDEMIKPGLVFVVMATSGSRPIAAAVFFHFGKKAVYASGLHNVVFGTLPLVLNRLTCTIIYPHLD